MTAIRGGQPDRVPIWELIINRPVIKALYPDLFSTDKVKQYEWGSCGGFLLQADFVEQEDLDGITVFEDYRVQEEIDADTFSARSGGDSGHIMCWGGRSGRPGRHVLVHPGLLAPRVARRLAA